MSLKVTTKKNLIIFYDPEDWYRVLDRLEQDFGTAIRMRHIMKRELGFTARDHRGLEPNKSQSSLQSLSTLQLFQSYYYQQQVHLDFYADIKEKLYKKTNPSIKNKSPAEL